MKRCLSLRIYRWLGKIQWNIVTLKRRFLQLFKYERYYWCRLRARVYLGLSILELSKILMYEFWYDYVKPIHGEKAKLCYMDADSFIVYIKTCDIYKDIAEDI